ncbi:ankyrin repeat domain-containing protein [Thiobacillus sp.]|uniref:ankyrin repeat domain-containing protein n=1 Tax=Thiobacillus sp. TaxID=924 RepID=UPI001845EFAC|nr:ankyrin repeat domain-containing protein [Thiobacillus sp.]MBC2729981.1 ankyrin repeat domain-containing protein [Thiobacillus sp.]MBC2738718.1 ankyrin repeat domain-containing protein [Thiobacillus sp.]MBC2760989.1 ankyrin repeat domain-containing protein [Thiobacillus sp.]MBD3810601.1 ankyrin repeat domain-containing protein [Betaproteobacteria bacterium]
MSQELFAAAQSGDTAQIKTLLEAGADHAAVDEAGETALMHAAHAGHVAAVQLLIAAGADVNAKSPQGWTALAKAAYNSETERGYVEVIEVLHEAGASLDERIFFGITPLMLAAGGGDAPVVEWLINTGADVLAANEGGRTARMMADDKFYVDVINLLHEAEQQLGVSVDGSCSSTRGVAKPQVVNLMKPTTH